MFAWSERMNKFEAIHPSILLAPYVRQYWFVTLEDIQQNSQRLVPIGCAALTFHRSNRTYSIRNADYLPQSYLYGIATSYTDLVLSGSIDFVCIVFQPAAVKAFFKMPINELNNKYISLDILNDPELQELEQRLSDTMDNVMCIRLIEQFLLHRIYKFDNYKDERLNTVIRLIHKGETVLDRLAEISCLGYKQFKRIFTAHIGANPKDYMQIIRFQKLHHLLQQHTPMTVTQLAYECGYYDKSHLIRELKDFSGFTPTGLQKACDPVYSDYHGLFRLAFVDLSSN